MGTWFGGRMALERRGSGGQGKVQTPDLGVEG